MKKIKKPPGAHGIREIAPCPNDRAGADSPRARTAKTNGKEGQVVIFSY